VTEAHGRDKFEMAMRLEMTAARTTKVVIATSAMLSFISFWRAAAIVLNDLGSSAYYVGGIAERRSDTPRRGSYSA